MKNTKKIISLVLAICMLASLARLTLRAARVHPALPCPPLRMAASAAIPLPPRCP